MREYGLPLMQCQGAIQAWIVDDTGFRGIVPADAALAGDKFLQN